MLQKSKSEYDQNKILIQNIKDKWSRIAYGVSMDYHSLENAEKENYRLMKKKKKRMAAKVLFLVHGVDALEFCPN